MAKARTEEAEATVKVASADTNSDVNATVIEVAAGRGYLKSVQQLMTSYPYGVMVGYVTVTIDGVALPELELSRAEFAGDFPGELMNSINVFYAPSIRYETSLKVQHRFVKTTGGIVKTVVSYTEE